MESDVAWSKVLDRSVGFEKDLLLCSYSEGKARALRHQQQTNDLHDSIRNERMSMKRAKKAARLRRLARGQSDVSATLLPDDATNGGLEGRELKSWKILMKRHAQVVSTANVRVSSKLEKHVEHRRKDLRKKSRARFENATAEDGGMIGNQLEWWKRQRELHERVVKGASVRIETEHEKHVLVEWQRKKDQRAVENANFDPADGGLEGPERKHWRIMRDRHDQMIDDATKTIDTELGKHVLEYREALEKKKAGPDGEVEAGLDGRELKNWRLFQKVHDNIIANAKSREDTHLDVHALRYRKERKARSTKRFEHYDISSGGLEGPELKLWHHIRETHDRVVDSAATRVDVELPKHVREERERKKEKRNEKWSNYDPDVTGGTHGVELKHWKIMHALHDKLVATAVPTVKTRLDKHVQEYQHHLKKKHTSKWSEKDNAGLSGRELKWWREQLEIYERLKKTAKSTMIGSGPHGEGDMELPKHVKDYRNYLNKQRAEKERTRTDNDGMLSGPNLEHWKIMRGIHDELISTATKTIDVTHEKHVQHHMDYVKERSKVRWNPDKGFTAGLDGPELHHWHEMTKLHERVVAAAQPQVDCHRVKSVAELVMEKRHEEKWGTKPHTAMKKKKKKKKNTLLQSLNSTNTTQLLTEAEYERALEIAAVVQREIYTDRVTEEDQQNSRQELPTWRGVRALQQSTSPTRLSSSHRGVPAAFATEAAVLYEKKDIVLVNEGEESYTRRRLRAALSAANQKSTSKSTSSTNKNRLSPLMLSAPKGKERI
jgi:hypothetical protein